MQLQSRSNIIGVPTSVMISHEKTKKYEPRTVRYEEVSCDRLTDNLKVCLRFNSIATKTKQVTDTLGVLSHWGGVVKRVSHVYIINIAVFEKRYNLRLWTETFSSLIYMPGLHIYFADVSPMFYL